MTTLRIPLEPYPKERPRYDGRHKRFYTPNSTVKATKELGAYLAQHWPRPHPGELGPVVLHIGFFPTRQHGDLDNYLKLFMDAANGICWKDDRQVTEIRAAITAGSAGFTAVTIEPVHGGPDPQ